MGKINAQRQKECRERKKLQLSSEWTHTTEKVLQTNEYIDKSSVKRGARGFEAKSPSFKKLIEENFN